MTTKLEREIASYFVQRGMPASITVTTIRQRGEEPYYRVRAHLADGRATSECIDREVTGETFNQVYAPCMIGWLARGLIGDEQDPFQPLDASRVALSFLRINHKKRATLGIRAEEKRGNYDHHQKDRHSI